MKIIATHAGDDSDGKIWGLEGINILFLLAGLLVGLGLALLLSRNHRVSVSFGIGAMPFLLVSLYILTLRQGKPKSYDTDLLETLVTGTGWKPPVKQPLHPLFNHANS